MARACQSWGGWLHEEDLAAYAANWKAPISIAFRNMEVFTTPPPSQGFALLMALRALESVLPDNLFQVISAETVHVLVEVANVALALRDRFNGEDASEKLTHVFSEIAAFPKLFDSERHRTTVFEAGGTRKGDTAHLAIVDKSGMSVSLIQSLFYDFGTCIPITSGGYTLQNRGAAFTLQEDHPGSLVARRRPPHTLMPTIVRQSSKPRYVLGCMGGDGQIQTQLQLLVDLCVGGLDPQQAVSRPRWYLERGKTDRIIAEQGAMDAAKLEKKGHRVTVMRRFEEIMGHAQVIELAAGGILVGAADPRSDGYVAAF
jgi:gamma-glutamyltranspeptidase/glutathione hydrolase